jgi:hypothetical protein
MSEADSDQQMVELKSSLDQTVALLEEHGETHWRGWFETCQRELVADHAAALGHILGAFGGMGSFNDLLICGENGHVVEPELEQAVNDRLRRLRTAIWTSATALRDEL